MVILTLGLKPNHIFAKKGGFTKAGSIFLFPFFLFYALFPLSAFLSFFLSIFFSFTWWSLSFFPWEVRPVLLLQQLWNHLEKNSLSRLQQKPLLCHKGSSMGSLGPPCTSNSGHLFLLEHNQACNMLWGGIRLKDLPAWYTVGMDV